MPGPHTRPRSQKDPAAVVGAPEALACEVFDGVALPAGALERPQAAIVTTRAQVAAEARSHLRRWRREFELLMPSHSSSRRCHFLVASIVICIDESEPGCNRPG